MRSLQRQGNLFVKLVLPAVLLALVNDYLIGSFPILPCEH